MRENRPPGARSSGGGVSVSGSNAHAQDLVAAVVARNVPSPLFGGSPSESGGDFLEAHAGHHDQVVRQIRRRAVASEPMRSGSGFGPTAAGCHKAVQAASKPSASSPLMWSGKSSRRSQGSRTQVCRYFMARSCQSVRDRAAVSPGPPGYGSRHGFVHDIGLPHPCRACRTWFLRVPTGGPARRGGCARKVLRIGSILGGND